MELNDLFAKLDAVFLYDFPSANRTYLENGFLPALRNAVTTGGLEKLIVKPDGKPDLDWISFAWWIFLGDAPRINDALHGFLWTPEGNGHTLSPTSSLATNLLIDPIVRAERIKIKDYIKHISWVYHKTQVLPRITIVGSDNIPERLYGLHQSEITLLDPKVSLPKEQLFPDFRQRRNFHTVQSDEIFDELGSKTDLCGTQNVVILDRRNLVFSALELEQLIIQAGKLLTHHGRCLFDIPMYGKALEYSRLLDVAREFTEIPARFISSNISVMDSYVHEVVSAVNQAKAVKDEDYAFEIEELKLTDVGLSQSVAMRVYLKKKYID